MIAGSRKPISYLNTAKRLLGEHGRLELCALGIALAPLVTVAGARTDSGPAGRASLTQCPTQSSGHLPHPPWAAVLRVHCAEILKAEKLAVEERVETAFETVSNGPRSGSACL